MGIALAGFSCVDALRAQLPAWRAASTFARTTVQHTAGAKVLFTAEAGSVRARTEGQSSGVALAIGMDTLGGFFEGPGGSVVLCGHNAATGTGEMVVIDVVVDSGAVTALSARGTVSQTTSDFLAGTWSDSGSTLYLLDRENKTLLVAPWGSAQPLPGSFGIALSGAAAAPFFADDRPLGIDAEEAPSTSVIVGVSNSFAGAGYYRVVGSSGTYAALFVPTNGPEYLVSAPVNSLGPVCISGPLGPVSIVRVSTGVSVLASNITQTAAPTCLSLAEPLVTGEAYFIRGASDSNLFFPALRYGDFNEEAGVAWSQTDYTYDENVVGSADFGVYATLGPVGAALSSGFSTPITLSIAAVASGGSPTLALFDSTNSTADRPIAVLVPGAVLAGPSLEVPKRTGLLTGFDIPIPADDSLAGTFLYAQFVGTGSNGEALVSDVFGVEIGSLAAMSRSAAADPSRALESWMRRSSSPRGEELHRRLLERLRRR